jgi:hypothetical protein
LFGSGLKLPHKKKVFFCWFSWSTLLWHRCYYPHRSRVALSPVCGIFFVTVSRWRGSGEALSRKLPIIETEAWDIIYSRQSVECFKQIIIHSWEMHQGISSIQRHLQYYQAQ